MTKKDDEAWLRDTGLTCAYDGDIIEYTDGVVVMLVVKPYLIEGRLTFYDVTTEEEENDYYYEPVLFSASGWDEVQEKFREYMGERTPVSSTQSIVGCTFCKSGVEQGELMGVATFGEVHRSQRNPDLHSYGNHFENLDRNPSLFCIACLTDFNSDVHELWEDAELQAEVCEDGLYARCWRSGCEGNCEKKE